MYLFYAESRAAHEGNLRVVHNLCMMPDIDILAADSLGNTAAHHAAVMGHIDSLHYLLECEKLAKNKGLKLMLEEPTKPLGGVDEYGRDVLHHAVENGFCLYVEVFLHFLTCMHSRTDRGGAVCVITWRFRHYARRRIKPNASEESGIGTVDARTGP